ncbi:MAG: hypothetical protein LQ340_000794 [Diploschistes diacapsis]|nr:MAG: hypothetical protein LQ340_000794 [Diploschistes diacapsis]
MIMSAILKNGFILALEASFEKSLSAISAKITRATTDLDSCRQRSRRFKALWTLYSSFAYLLYIMIIGLVVGFKNCGIYDYTALVGGSVIIYAVRLVLSTYYNYRISKLQSHVNSLQKQRDNIITKLKAATKYDSTQQLLEKYGGTPARPKQKPVTQQKPSSETKGLSNSRNGTGRTNVMPPPTANIPQPPRSGPASAPNSPNPSAPVTPRSNPPYLAAATTPLSAQQRHTDSFSPDDSAEFAPNAFSTSTHYAQAYSDGGSKWYDRLLDVLLGEDETNAKNRLALICGSCRLVNGQAPPGVKRLEDVGKWRCSGCGRMNGAEDEGKRLVAEITGQGVANQSVDHGKKKVERVEEELALMGKEGEDSDITQYSDDAGKSKGEVEKEE